MINKKAWRKHKTEIVFVAAALIAVVVGHKDIQNSMQSLNQERALVSIKASEERRLEQSQELAKNKAEIAQQRYKDGCAIVVAVNSPKNLATLVEGETVYDRTSKKPLPSGTIVCDANGNTGILSPNKNGVPVVSSVAFTGNRELAIEQVRKIRGAKVYYYTPEK